MTYRTIHGVTVLALLAACQATVAGPDVIVGDLHNTAHYGPVMMAGPDEILGSEDDFPMHAYAIGTVSCNVGDTDLLWIAGNNQHPVIGQHMFRLDLDTGRYMQVGQSWLKHGFTALTQNLCDTCSGVGGAVLGVGCSDPYGAGLNGSQNGLGPKFEVNPSNGVFTYPYSNPNGSTGNQIFKRLQVPQRDLDVNNYPNALFFVEGQYVTQDDSQSGNGANNASYRRITVNNTFAPPLTQANYNISVADQTQRTKPGIFGWKDYGGGLSETNQPIPDPSVLIIPIDVRGDGRFWVASKAIDNGDGTWRYEYAIQNLTSYRAGANFSVAIPGVATVSDVGFSGVMYHSGEPFSNEPWINRVEANRVVWEVPDRPAINPNTSALRWGTMYNFWFTTNVAPNREMAVLGLFRPDASGNSEDAIVVGPKLCVCDLDANGLDSTDFYSFCEQFFGPGLDLNNDGQANADDLMTFLDCFFGGC